MGQFDKYEQIVEGKTKIVLKDKAGKVEDEFELIVRNSEKMLILNFFTAQSQAARKMESVDTRFTDKIEALYIQLFRRAYPKENATNIVKMINDRFVELMTAFMVGFKWTTEDEMEQAKEQLKESIDGKKKPGSLQQMS